MLIRYCCIFTAIITCQLVCGQDLKAKQISFINDFIDRINKSDTTDLSLLLSNQELRDFLKKRNSEFPLLILEKANEDRRLVRYLNDYNRDCYDVKTGRIYFTEDQLVQVHKLDSKRILLVQQKLREGNDSITNKFFQRYLNYREFILSKKDTTWRGLYGKKICDQNLFKDGNGIVEFFGLPAQYKWVVGRFKKHEAKNSSVQLKNLEYSEIYNEKGFTASEPILNLVNENGEILRIKLHLMYFNKRWKIYLPLEGK